MSTSQRYRLVLLLSACALWSASPCQSGVLLKPNGEDAMPIFTRSVTARAEISGQFAKTTLVMVFQNESHEQIEADFIYALPPGAVATYFAYWAGEEKVVAKIVERKEAARIYEHLTAYSRDPALIEFKDKNTFRARISPVFADQDLKVEIRYVQSLQSNGDRVSYSVPIGPAVAEQSDPLESVDATILVKGDDRIRSVSNNYGVPVAKESGDYRITIKGNDYTPPKDLAVSVTRTHSPLRAEVCAEPGSKHFSLALTPDHSLKHPQVSISGISVTQLAPVRLPDVRSGHAVVVSGRYGDAGKAIVRLSGQGSRGWKVYSTPVVFAASATTGIAPKLWAAARIQDLGSRRSNRKAAVKLSFSYGLPSRYTSWLAVPKTELRRLAREAKYEEVSARIQALAVKMVDMIVGGEKDSAEYPRLDEQYTKLHEGFGGSPDEELVSQLRQKRYEVVQKLIGLRNADKPDAAAEAVWTAKGDRATAELRRLSPREAIKTIDEYVAQEEPWRLQNQRDYLSAKLARAIAEGKDSSPDARALRARYDRFGKKAKESSTYDPLYASANQLTYDLARQIVNERHKPKPKAELLAELNKKLNRIAPSALASPAQVITDAEKQWAEGRSWSEADTYTLAVEQGKTKEAEVHRRRYYQLAGTAGRLDAKAALDSTLRNHFENAVREYLYWSEQGLQKNRAKMAQYRKAAERLSSLTGLSFRDQLREYTESDQVYYVANRMYDAADLLKDELDRQHPFRSRVERLRRQTGTVAAELKKLDKDQDYTKPVEEFNSAADRAIDAWLEEQKVKSQVRSGAAGQTEIERAGKARQETLRDLQARLYYIRGRTSGGDPLISVDAPENALQVIALLPDGDVKTLAWNEKNRRWEARFDVPTGTPDGDYVVTVVAMLPDGTRKTTSVGYKVDNTPPSGLASAAVSGQNRQSLRLEVKPSEDVARIVALLPWGERVELRRPLTGDVYTALVQMPAMDIDGKVEFVLTDNAHNRASLFSDVERQ